MRLKLNGTTRIVFLIGNYAIKIPNHVVCHQHFLQGCYANWSERRYTKTFERLPEFYNKIAPTIFCSWFGLLSIQRRVVELDRHLTVNEVEYFKDQTTDIKMQNFGYLDKRLVCIDYV